MADRFRRLLDRVGWGGVKCPCCNKCRKNKHDRRLLRKSVKAQLKQELREEEI